MLQTHKKKPQTGISLIQDIPIQIPIGLAISPTKFQTIHLKIISQDYKQVASTGNNIFDEIPQLEQDWENSQFTDADTNLINRHNMHSESERIWKEYTEHLLDLTDNQYYSEQYSSIELQYSIPDQDYYGPPPKRSNTQPHDPTGYYPPTQTQQMFSTGTHVEEENMHFYRDIDFFGEKTHSGESRKARKRWQNFKQQIRKLSSCNY